MKRFFLKNISAWLPVTVSLAALVFTISYIAIIGIPKVKTMHDEGAAARIFQLLMIGQVPVILFFLFKWFPKKPREAVYTFILQVLAGILAFMPVYLLEL